MFYWIIENILHFIFNYYLSNLSEIYQHSIDKVSIESLSEMKLLKNANASTFHYTINYLENIKIKNKFNNMISNRSLNNLNTLFSDKNIYFCNCDEYHNSEEFQIMSHNCFNLFISYIALNLNIRFN